MITNKTTNQNISDQELQCTTIYSQARGLMFRRKRNLLMIFPEEKFVQLHMFFVFYPIEVILLNKNRQVIEIKEKFQPWHLWNSTQPAKYVLELGRESSQGKIEVGDILSF